MLNTWLHVIALVIYLGAVLGFWSILIPAIPRLARHQDRALLLARALKIYNPLQIGALGILLFTGAFQLTELKAAYRENFIAALGYPLGMKLTFAFILVLFSVYQSMGIGHRFVKRFEGGEAVTEKELDQVLRRLKSAGWIIVPVGFVTIWFGLRLTA